MTAKLLWNMNRMKKARTKGKLGSKALKKTLPSGWCDSNVA